MMFEMRLVLVNGMDTMLGREFGSDLWNRNGLVDWRDVTISFNWCILIISFSKSTVTADPNILVNTASTRGHKTNNTMTPRKHLPY